jgi:Domain of unknown function (DUF4386)
MMETKSKQKLARIAGVLYLFIAILGFWGIMYVPSQTIVRGDGAATIIKLLSNEFLFRSGIMGNLASSVIFLFLALTFYRIFKNVNENLAKILVVLVIVQTPVFFISEALNFSALMVAKGELMKSFDTIQRQDFVLFLIRTSKYVIIILQIFWGLWLIPLGQLILKSGYLPRIIGILLILAGVCYVIEVMDYILLSEKLSFITDYFALLYSVAELSTVFWLLVKGVKTNS